jgi:hypothetical protein
MSIINKAPEMVKREYELQEPITLPSIRTRPSFRARRITSSIPR